MGFFANGTQGQIYESKYCYKCAHYDNNDEGCQVWLAHLIYNYDNCKNENSILQLLIPYKNGSNYKCTMFIESKEDRETEKLFEQDYNIENIKEFIKNEN